MDYIYKLFVNVIHPPALQERGTIEKNVLKCFLFMSQAISGDAETHCCCLVDSSSSQPPFQLLRRTL
jgi:hypothetical protein